MNNDKMGFIDYLWALLIILLAFSAASCVSEENQTVCLTIYQPVCTLNTAECKCK